MMINKRLIGTVRESKKYIAGNVICQWVSLAANISMMGSIAHLLQKLYEGEPGSSLAATAAIAAIAVIIRFDCAVASSRMGCLSSKAVKKTLREMLYRKLLRLGASYKEQANTSEVVQVAVKGVDQLETYFGAYLPQFFYAMLAPLTLFAVLSFISFPAAIVGESGCGKTTMAAIAMGRNKGYSGDLTVGGIPLSEISEESLMENFTYISHQSYLFKGTVRENLLMARPNAGEDPLWQVLNRVNLASFLRSENGLDTLLNEKGSNLSSGQCQRLALARALLHDAPFLLLDEPTSNLDSLNEAVILKFLHEERSGKTVVLVSHRKSTMGIADTVYDLEHGRMS